MSRLPAVSVVIPVYNGSRTLCRALDSVLAQTEPAAEVIIVDDGSTDDTRRVVKAYLEAQQLPRWHLIHQPNGGPAKARDTGIRSARGTCIALLDADDAWSPEKLARSAHLLAEHRLDLVGAQMRPNSTATECQIVDRRKMLFKNPFFTSTMVFTKAAYLAVGGFDCQQRYSEDYKLWLAFAWQGKRCGTMNLPYAAYRPDASSSHQGLSSHRWRMQCCESANFTWLHRSGLAPWGWCAAAQVFSWLKYFRRLWKLR